MGYIPKEAKWYLAELIQEITVTGESRNVVHTNLTLVRADSAEEAYEKALALGAEGQISYTNLQGQWVKITFRGLRDLNVIHGELEHGAELIYSEDIGVNESDIQAWMTPKEKLGVFAPIAASEGPDYRAREVVEEMYERSRISGLRISRICDRYGASTRKFASRGR